MTSSFCFSFYRILLLLLLVWLRRTLFSTEFPFPLW